MDRESTTRLCTGAEGRAGLTVQVIERVSPGVGSELFYFSCWLPVRCIVWGLRLQQESARLCLSPQWAGSLLRVVHFVSELFEAGVPFPRNSSLPAIPPDGWQSHFPLLLSRWLHVPTDTACYGLSSADSLHVSITCVAVPCFSGAWGWYASLPWGARALLVKLFQGLPGQESGRI